MSDDSDSGGSYHIGLKLAGLILLLPFGLASAGVIPADGKGWLASATLVWAVAGVLGLGGLWFIWRGR